MHQVVHKNKVEDIKAFFETDTNTILKYVCKSEDHFLLYLKENQKLVADERKKNCLRRKAVSVTKREAVAQPNHKRIKLSVSTFYKFH